MHAANNRWYAITNESEVPSPSVLIYPDRIQANLRRMIRWAGPAGVDRLRPHVKTHKLPQIIEMKLEAGISKFKTSTIAEAEMTAAAGGRDILIAYQQVGPNIERLIGLIKAFPLTEFSTIVDDAAIADQLNDSARAAGLVVRVFADVNVGMNRTGVSLDNAAELYRHVDGLDALQPAGIHAYDGHLHLRDESKLRSEAERAFAPVWELRDALRAEGRPVPSVVGCGTPTSKFMAEQHEIEISAGTSVLWDAGQPAFSPSVEIENAAILLTRVISRPTAETLCIDLGHKAVASEMSPPRVRLFGLKDAEQVIHSEEHLVLRSKSASDYPVGTVLYGIPYHVCPTMALHNEVWCVRDQVAQEQWPVVARGRRLTL
ncbi:MAG: D-TA family PLP-dependent enzyme [Planctomycetota bacterium]